MWKLIKSEISYFKWPILAGYLFLIVAGFLYNAVVGLPSYWPDGPIAFMYSPWKTFNYLTIKVMPISLILIFATLYIQTREYRIRQIVSLPLHVVQVGISRLILPLLVVILLLLAALIPALILGVIHHSDVETLWKYSVNAQRFGAGQMKWGDNPFITFSYTLHYIPNIITLCYLLWLFTENYGRIILGAFIAYEFLHNGIMPSFASNPAYISDKLLKKDLIYQLLFSDMTLVSVIVLFGCMFIIFYSFMRRRSYLL
jgi:hypothetical protein